MKAVFLQTYESWLDKFFPHGATKEKPRNTKVKVDKPDLKMPVTKDESTRARTLKRETKLVDKAINTIEQHPEEILPRGRKIQLSKEAFKKDD